MGTLQLRPQVSLSSRGGIPVLEDRAGGRVLPLTETEARVVAAIGTGTTTAALTEALAGRGLNRAVLATVVHRFVAFGFLALDGAPTPIPGATGDALDGLPRLRDDLQVTPSRAPGMVEVGDLQAGASFTFFEFELTIARMLDGHRTPEQVSRAAERLGIRAGVASVKAFVSQLESLGLLQQPRAPTPPAVRLTPPPTQDAWLPELREMFNFALGFARAGQLDEATKYLEELLAIDGSLQEARALLAEVRGHSAGEAAGLHFESMHSVHVPPPTPTSAPVTPSAVRPIAAAAAPPPPWNAPPDEGPRPRGGTAASQAVTAPRRAS